jgi:hypothetical protein
VESAGAGQSAAEGDNLTETAATQLAGIISATGSQDVEVTLDNIDELIQEALDAGSQEIILPEVDVEKIKIKEQKYSKLSDEERAQKENEDATDYLVSAAYILASNSPETLTSPENLGVIVTPPCLKYRGLWL